MIFHIDMDAFFASIEQAVNPKLQGKPLIVGSRGSKLHTVVCAASYEAKAYGIDSGMPSLEAFQLCPGLKFVVADQSKYIWTSEQIFELLKGYGFEVAYASIDEFQMDIPDALNPQTLAKNIQEQIRETFKITASIGIARNGLLAKLASKLNKPNGIAVLGPDNLDQVLAEVPVKKLCGVGDKTGMVFEVLGIKTCLDLYQKSAQFLEQNLGQRAMVWPPITKAIGQNGLNLYLELHSSEHFQAKEIKEKPKSVGHSYTLPVSSQNTGFIRAWIRLLSEMVGRRLRQQNMACKTVHLWLSGPEMAHFGAQKTYREITNDSYEIYLKALKIMAMIGVKTPKTGQRAVVCPPIGKAIRALGITCSNLFPADNSALLKEDKRKEGLIKALDSINTRQGDWSIYPAAVTLTRHI